MGLEKADFAACTFVGLSIDKKQWQSLALGDSYLFVLDKNLEIIESVASQKGEEFSNFPEYFADDEGNLVKYVENGTVREGSAIESWAVENFQSMQDNTQYRHIQPYTE